MREDSTFRGAAARTANSKKKPYELAAFQKNRMSASDFIGGEAELEYHRHGCFTAAFARHRVRRHERCSNLNFSCSQRFCPKRAKSVSCWSGENSGTDHHGAE